MSAHAPAGGDPVNFHAAEVSDGALARWVLLAAVLSAGCAGAPSQSVSAARPLGAVAVVVPPPTPLAASSPPPPSSVSPSIPAISRPSALACELGPTPYSHSELRLSPEGPVFASIRSAPTTIFFPLAGPAATATLEMEDRFALLRAHVSADELPIFLRGPTGLMGFVFPASSTRLDWVGSKAGALRVAVDASRVLAWPEHPGDDVPCAGLSAYASEFAVRDAVTKKQKLPELTVQHDGAELALEPGGTPVAGLRSGAVAQILETRAGASRILVDANSYLVVGWVASSALGKGYGVGYGRLGRRHGMRSRAWTHGRSCDHDLELVAQVGEARVRVGVLKAGALYDLGEQANEADVAASDERRVRREQRWRTVFLPQVRWLSVQDGARLLVDEADIAACTAESAGE